MQPTATHIAAAKIMRAVTASFLFNLMSPPTQARQLRLIVGGNARLNSSRSARA
jgi:hypothetical protein